MVKFTIKWMKIPTESQENTQKLINNATYSVCIMTINSKGCRKGTLDRNYKENMGNWVGFLFPVILSCNFRPGLHF